MKYKVAIFDMDGTILNTLEDLSDTMNYCLKKYHMPERTIDEIRKRVGADTLAYLSLENLPRMLGENGECGLCDACFSGCYPTETPTKTHKNRFEQKISEKRKGEDE